jgi:signal peptidase II
MLCFLLPLAIILPLDQITKTAIVKLFYYGERVSVIPGFFELTHVRNPGGAFSFFADGPAEIRMTFFIGSTVVALVLLVMFLRRLEPDAALSAMALGSIMGGALGNLIDRLVYGEVIDLLMFHLTASYTWPTFNVADSAIVVGVAILMLEIVFEGRGESRAGSGTESGAEDRTNSHDELAEDAASPQASPPS